MSGDVAILTKAAATIEGIMRALDPDMDIMEVGMPYARELARRLATIEVRAPQRGLLLLARLVEIAERGREIRPRVLAYQRDCSEHDRRFRTKQHGASRTGERP